ncbi:hypothetical protein GRF29_19g2380472 [Pseudopithomyces chartarum]|uniref:Zinc finger PHD-type domain-containing protein n=1 Tax=Pseudopithomyces chartarum TaxID=1892770 RepID=A0AAN6RKL8_9PLEO|nr:hypothetical protein GRF29_19g2380472 [Pseudopithomyces chartarum]
MAHSTPVQGAPLPATYSTPSSSMIYGSTPSSQLHALHPASSSPTLDSICHPSYYEILSTQTPADPKAKWRPEGGKYASWEEAEKAARQLMNAVAASTAGSNVFEGGNKFWVVDASMMTKIQYQIAAVEDAPNTAPPPLRFDTPSASDVRPKTSSQLHQSPDPSSDQFQNDVPRDQMEQECMESQDVNKVHALSDGNKTLSCEDLMTIKQEQGASQSASALSHPTPSPETLPHGAARETGEASTETISQVFEQPNTAPQTVAAIDLTTEAAATSAPNAVPAEKAQQLDTSGRFGLYLTLKHPSSPSVTYLVQLNTSLGQAQSDMKVIATNEIDKDVAKDPEGLPHITFDDCEIDIAKNQGAQLVYEIVKGSFVDGRFESHMEQSGRATGESYTKEMMKTEPAHQCPIKMATDMADVASEVFEAVGNTSSRGDGITIDEEIGFTADGKDIREDSKSSTTTMTLAEQTTAVLQHDQDVHQAVETVMSDTEPDEAIEKSKDLQQGEPQQEEMQQDDLHQEKPQQEELQQEVSQQEELQQEEQQHPAQVASPSRKRSREPDNDNTDQPSTQDATSVGPPRKKTKTVANESMNTAQDEEMTDVAGNEAEDIEDPDAVYCRCREGDDGSEMVGCDGEDCISGGWVHWRCISTKKGKPGVDMDSWLCPDCDPARKKKKGGAAYGWSKTAMAKGAAAKRKGGSAANKKRLVR